MTIRQEMLKAVASGAELLGDARDLTVDFIRDEMNNDGGFRNRAGESDLYYTVFGIEILLALRADFVFDPVVGYLRTFGDGEGLDLVHLACLGRCWANMPKRFRQTTVADMILGRIESTGCQDSGYSHTGDLVHGSAYGCFLAFGAHQDLQAEMSNVAGIISSLESLRTEDGAYANEYRLAVGSTPATAAAVVLLRHLRGPIQNRADGARDRSACAEKSPAPSRPGPRNSHKSFDPNILSDQA